MNPAPSERATNMLSAVSQLLPQQMDNWATHFGPIPNAPQRSPDTKKKILLTGCTGFLGRHLLGQLVRWKDIGEICVLVHEDSSRANANAVAASTQQRVQAALKGFATPATFSGKVTILGGSTTERWNRATYHKAASGLTDIIHAA